jgi:hypothetical protein
MEKFWLAGRALGRVFNFISSMHAIQLKFVNGRKCGRALSVPHSVSQLVSMHDYYINSNFLQKGLIYKLVKKQVFFLSWD